MSAVGQEIGKMGRRRRSHHPDVGVVMMGKSRRRGVHHIWRVVKIRALSRWWRELIVSENC